MTDTWVLLCCLCLCMVFRVAWLWLAAGVVPGSWRAETRRASDRLQRERHSTWLSDRPGRKASAAAAAADVPALLPWPATRKQRPRPFTAGHLRLRDPGQPGLGLHRGRGLLHGHWDWPLRGARALPRHRGQPPAPSAASRQTGILGGRGRRAGPGEPQPPSDPEPDAAARTSQAEGALLPGPCGHRGQHEPQQESGRVGEGRLHPLNMHHTTEARELLDRLRMEGEMWGPCQSG